MRSQSFRILTQFSYSQVKYRNERLLRFAQYHRARYSRPRNIFRAKQKVDSYKFSFSTLRAIACGIKGRAWRKMMGSNGALIVLLFPHNLE